MSRVLVIARVVWLEMLRRKDAYVLLILLVALMGLLLGLDVFGGRDAVRHVTELGMLLAWLCALVLTVGLSARQLPQEERRGTIYPLLAKPIGRGELVSGKWLGAWLAGLTATAAFYLAVGAAARLRGAPIGAATLGQGYLLHAAFLAVVAALAVALSTRMGADAAATLAYVLTAAAFLLTPSLPEMLEHEPGPARFALRALDLALPHFELFDLRRRIVHGYGPAAWPAVAGALAYGALWTAFLLTLAWLTYRRKYFKRELVG